jgi:uncharacterized membrane protein SpoIIM required for sporulation
MTRLSQPRTTDSAWLERRVADWRGLAGGLANIERGKSADTAAVLAAVRAYPEIARDLAIARRAAPRAQLTLFLERIYLQLHRTIFRSPERFWPTVRALFERDAAAVAKELRTRILVVTALFFLSAAAGAWLVTTFSELIALVAPEELVATVQRGELWTDGLLNVMPSSLLAVQIFTNNIVVSLFAVALGVLYGLGTLYIIGMNGFSIGAIFGFTAQYGLAGRLFGFVAAHGFVELSIIFVSGAVGLTLGEALARPGNLTRGAAFQRAVTRGMRLMVVCLVFMVGAGIIEGYVSPDPRFPLAARLAIGLSYFVLFVLVLSGALGRFSARRAAAAAQLPRAG